MIAGNQDCRASSWFFAAYIMQTDLALVIPAAGRGSRFSKLGIREPKPLIDLHGRPFFWWSVESVRRVFALRQLIFVVLEEHVAEFAIDKVIRGFYPDATVVAIPEVTSGAAETAKIGISALHAPGPIAINDCDHAFICPAAANASNLFKEDCEGVLMSFRSSNPAYSYIRLNAQGDVVGTAEKQVLSPFAIAGCYFFADAGRFSVLYEIYKKACPYPELFVSGIFNLLAEKKLKTGMLELERHCSFGTPDERALISDASFAPFMQWREGSNAI